jgi:hypothetical protein
MCSGGGNNLLMRMQGKGLPPMGSAELERRGIMKDGVVNAAMGVDRSSLKLRGPGLVLGQAFGMAQR